jgi:hypothetical protein
MVDPGELHRHGRRRTPCGEEQACEERGEDDEAARDRLSLDLSRTDGLGWASGGGLAPPERGKDLFVPQRLDRIRIVCPQGIFAIPGRSRDALVDEIEHLESAAEIRDALVAEGASRPVTLSGDDVAILSGVLDSWARKSGAQQLPPGLWELRNGLQDDSDT